MGRAALDWRERLAFTSPTATSMLWAAAFQIHQAQTTRWWNATHPARTIGTLRRADLPDNQVSDMACGALTVLGTPYIYCVGGSAVGQTTATARVFFYDPFADTVTTLTAEDNWPGNAAGTILPGGFAVVNNKLYLLGGFNINVASTNQIWQFDPTAAVGSKWAQMVNTPEGIMYSSDMCHKWHHLCRRSFGLLRWHGDRHDQFVQLQSCDQQYRHDRSHPACDRRNTCPCLQ